MLINSELGSIYSVLKNSLRVSFFALLSSYHALSWPLRCQNTNFALGHSLINFSNQEMSRSTSIAQVYVMMASTKCQVSVNDVKDTRLPLRMF